MCGIVGTLNLTQQHPIDPARLRRMLGAIRHRGPDQFGIYTFQDQRHGVGLGSARLSIIDLGGGQQPIGNEDGTLWIVFNGEIFNYVELRPLLERQGHRFATDTDTEVILHLYETYGPECVHHLNGQFAFAIWDERARRLFMARDRLGIRPVYYTRQAGALFFASEIKALLADPRVQAELDPVTLGQIFTCWSPLSPRTAFQGIQTLPPGHHLTVDAEGHLTLARYWQPSFPDAGSETPLTPQEAAHQLRELLVDATRIRLRADVPVGAYLSGGLDSSAITALIQHYTPRRLETFSIGFTDQAYDETPFQQAMARHLGTVHHHITCSHEEIGQVFPDVIWHVETPILRTSPAPLFLLSRLVHDHDFKVVLTGEGADEFLAGYNIFKEAKIRRFWAREPDSPWRPLLLQRIYPYIESLRQNRGAYLTQFFGRHLTEVQRPDYSHLIRWENTRRSHRFFAPALQHPAGANGQAPLDGVTLPPGFDRWSPLAQAQYLEITIFLGEYLLSSQGDRVAMAHSVEGRFPFLDYRVVEFCNSLPPRLKLRGLNEKYLLKRAVQDLLPAEIWQRAKRPYRAPIHRSFFPEGRPLEWVAELLSPARLAEAGCFNPDAVTHLTRKLARLGHLGETDDMALAGILSTQLVHHQFIAHFRPPAPLADQDDVKVVARGAWAVTSLKHTA
ncbi:asparagine synthase (glutamine-hydrolyzing) [Litorilinea aerophila]|uniref:asparagine synthase (glutamine-hydrolyzing) n=1 Tax=Litorilinea aerophila TaxID=1204385 RepID=A0A540VFF6_9CHLR|nr:asparagine synthase (glutamine-hydrolyzing) [Litorilinea aerophila]MCC9076791.1 asparagine synthase (glutamine-hydrolyzing) [Litorilinea aerophila]